MDLWVVWRQEVVGITYNRALIVGIFSTAAKARAAATTSYDYTQRIRLDEASFMPAYRTN